MGIPSYKMMELLETRIKMSDKFFIRTLLSAQLVNSPSLPFVPLQKFRSRIALPPSRIIDLTMAQTSVSPPPLRPSKANTHKVYSTSISQLSNPNSRITCSRNHGSCKFRFTYFSRSGFFLFNFLGDLVGSHLQYKVKVALCQLLGPIWFALAQVAQKFWLIIRSNK